MDYLIIMSIVQSNLLLEKLDLYSKLADGLKDFKEGKHESFDKAMQDIRNELEI